jgi:1,4-alpha-glucan branching enzyme
MVLRGRAGELRPEARVDPEHSLLSDLDLYLFGEGSHLELFEKLGAHPHRIGGVDGVYFAVWAPNATRVSVIGDFNGWERGRDPLAPRDRSGIWEGFVVGVKPGERYKYHVVARGGGSVDKADPLAFWSEVPPQTASRVCSPEYVWGDSEWMAARAARNSLAAPIAVYELHLGSWRRQRDGRFLGYRELAPMLAHYAHELGFTHLELLPVMEHPFYGSWGYQTTGYFAPTSRYGGPQDLMYLIDVLHQEGIGVILDWVPSHFPTDEAALGRFDGTHLYEHGDPRQGLHPDWNSFIFNYGRHEVRSFLLSSALWWLGKFHADMLRVDAVASMLYLDYSRRPGEWVPNRYGGHENLEAIEFLRRLNREVYARFPDVQTVAEESTAWPMVSRPAHLGGLGFGLKWDMGWMNDTLAYMRLDPIYRKFHHGQLTWRMHWAFGENYMLPLSHDEVVHDKGSLWSRLPGDAGQKFAQLRLLFGYMYAQPGKKLLFMGAELAQLDQWCHERELDWDLLAHPAHSGVQRWVRDLNTCYRGEPALHERDCEPEGFEWIDGADAEQSALAFLRRGRAAGGEIAVLCNFTPVVRHGYRVGVPRAGRWRELLNSDAELYGGGNIGNLGEVWSEPVPWHGQPQSIRVTLPPLAVCFFRVEG